VFENNVLRNILGPKREEITGDWRKLCNDWLRDYSGYRIQEKEIGQTCDMYGGREISTWFW
jgi:hypothetical protein